MKSMAVMFKKANLPYVLLVIFIAAGIGIGLFFLVSRVSRVTISLDAPAEAANKPVEGKIKIDLGTMENLRVPEKVSVYEYKGVASSFEEIEEIARKLGVSDKLKPDSNIEDLYSASNGMISFDYHSDDPSYIWRDKAKYGMENPDLPTKEESRVIATRVLRELGLLPDEAYVCATGGVEEETERDGENVKFFLYRDVIFSRKLDGYYVIGPGMRIKVSLGTNGELIGLDSTIRNLVPYKEYETKSIEDALRDAQRGKNTMNLHPEVEDPEVTKVEILYYADPASPENKFLQPVYCFSGPETCIYVPAIKQ